ncbi:hypothetical protein ACKKBF_B39795 [Auxenochlorella protothecoides x Auxenochlorella symbiontica]
MLRAGRDRGTEGMEYTLELHCTSHYHAGVKIKSQSMCARMNGKGSACRHGRLASPAVRAASYLNSPLASSD